MGKLMLALKRFLAEESGASMVEYALMVALVAAVCVTAVTALGTAVSGQFNTVAGNL
jgi:pilus assembly protein Flp/PilA